MKTSRLLIRGAIVAALGGLLFGFDTAVISGATEALQKEYDLTNFMLGFTVASALIGTILGAIIIKFPANSLGRVPTMIIIAVLYFVSAVGTGCPWDWYSFLFFRFIGGIGVGGASVVSPLYTAEISPAKLRGRLVAITQLNIVFGILLAYVSNLGIASIGLPEWLTWRLMFAVEAVPAALFFILLFTVKESPRWLMTKGKTEQARAILEQLGTDTGNVDEEITVIQRAIDAEKQGGNEAFFQHKYRIPILYAFLIAAFNQLSGINAILYYAPTVFEITGSSKSASLFSSVIIGFTNLVVTVLAMLVIDHFGRRKLLFVGSLGYILSLGIIAGIFFSYGTQFDKIGAISGVQKEVVKVIRDINTTKTESPSQEQQQQLEKMFQDSVTALQNGKTSDTELVQRMQTAQNIIKTGKIHDAVPLIEEAFQIAGKTVPPMTVSIVLGALMLFIAAHAFGQGAIIWVFIGEIFPNRVRAQGQAFGSFTHWVFCAAISWSFPPLLEKIGGAGVFAFYSGMMVLQLLWVIFVMPETKQISLEEMQKKLGIEE